MGARLTLLVPTFNEAARIERTLRTLLEAFSGQVGTEIVVVDSSTKDDTADIAERLAKTEPQLHVMRFAPGGGKGKKIRDGTLARQGSETYAFIDADLPITTAELMRIIDVVAQHRAQVAIASKYIRGGRSTRPVHRVLLSRLGNRLYTTLLGIPVHDLLAGAKAWSGEVATRVWPDVKNDAFFFDAEMLALAHRRGFTIEEVPVHYIDERVRDSKVNLWHIGVESLVNTAKLIGRR